MKKINLILIAILTVLVAVIFTSFKSDGLKLIPLTSLSNAARLEDEKPTPQVESVSEMDQSIEKSLKSATSAQKNVLAFSIYDIYVDKITYSDTGDTALLWLGMKDPETGEVIAAEPGLAIAHLGKQGKSLNDNEWDITLQADDNWSDQLSALPEELVNEDILARYSEDDAKSALSGTVYRGYKLPWAAGLEKRLSGSIGHFLIYYSCSETSCRYAYDFADGTMFPLLASKGGAVYSYNWDCPNGNTTCNNWIVLEDKSTTPTTYQLYLHMAYNSIPAELRKVGAIVSQGQYIGDVDNTGYSSGHHLHFHVFNYPTSSYWGNSVDIRFDEVSINDGTPRTCYEASNFPAYGTQCNPGDKFLSANQGTNPPAGDLTAPANGASVNDGILTVSGWAKDDRQVTKVQVVAKMDGLWQDIGAPMSGTSYSQSINLCEAGVPQGAVEIAVQIFDYEGNRALGNPGLRTIVNNGSCGTVTPPACNPSANQIALFTSTNYTGTCRLFEIGDYPKAADLGVIGDKNAESVLVGANVRAVFYDRQSLTIAIGRTESFEANDPNLFDNRMSANDLSSLRVQPRSSLPISIVIGDVTNNLSQTPTSAESYVLDFRSDGATGFKAELTGAQTRTLDWTYANNWSVGTLPAGNYNLKITARNSAGQISANKSFTIASGSLPSESTRTAPYEENFESGANGWNASYLWHQGSVEYYGGTTNAWIYNDGIDVGDPSIGGGDLTSPPIAIPASGYYLRFNSYSYTESFYPYWDNRLVQVSVNGGPFEDIYQFTFDAAKAWLTSPAINLSAYAGKTIRLRFHFDIVDPSYNAVDTSNNPYSGWYIDQIKITTDAPEAACSEASPNDSLATATSFEGGGQISGIICPGGDMDYYRFTGKAGQTVSIDVDAMEVGSALDPYIFLLDAQGHLLAENDDEIYATERDSRLGMILPADGVYYLRLKAWDHPRAGGSDYFYTLKMTMDDRTQPLVKILFPSSNYLPQNVFNIQVSAADSGSGMAYVDFYWHSPDWANGSWQYLGRDANGADGWQMSLDPNTKAPVSGSALYVKGVDGAGNQWSDLRTNLALDSVAPTSSLNKLTSPSQSTAVQLTWSANDNETGLDHFEIQIQDNSSTWKDWNTAVPGNQRQIWYVGQAGHTYAFRMRAVDLSGNVQSYPTSAQASVTSESSCAKDAYEDDDSASVAVSLPLETLQLHNICGAGDVDWVKVDVVGGTTYSFMSGSSGGGAANLLVLFDSNKTTELIRSNSPQVGQSTRLSWTANATKTVYLKLIPVEGVAGSGANYNVWYGEPELIYLPLILK